MSFNLNNAADFAAATSSAVGALADPLALLNDVLGRNSGKREWKIYEASFDGIIFHVFQTVQDFNAGLTSIADSGGRRIAVFKFPYKDGQTTNDLGRDGYSYSIDCIFHGKGYKDAWNNLKQRLDTKAIPGDLIHPITGKVRVKPKTWSYTHTSESHQAVMVKMEFVEHSFSVGSTILTDVDPTSKGALSGALDFLNKIQSTLTTVLATVNLARTFVSTINNSIAELTAFYRSALALFNFTFNQGNTTDTPETVSVQQGGTVSTGGTSGANAVSVSTSPSQQDNIDSTSAVLQVLTTQQVIDLVNQYRALVETLLETIAAQGAEIAFYELILVLKQSCNALQDVAEKGIKSAKPTVIQYKLFRKMSLREVAFVNGLTPDDVLVLDALNPTLDSTNDIPIGTVIQVPTNVAV